MNFFVIHVYLGVKTYCMYFNCHTKIFHNCHHITIGGNLGLCAGMSVLSMVEGVFLVCIIVMGIIQDIKQLKKLVSNQLKQLITGVWRGIDTLI